MIDACRVGAGRDVVNAVVGMSVVRKGRACADFVTDDGCKVRVAAHVRNGRAIGVDLSGLTVGVVVSVN